MTVRTLRLWLTALLLIPVIAAITAPAAWAQSTAKPANGEVTPGTALPAGSLSGTYTWQSTTIRYQSVRTGNTVESKIWGPNGQILATSHIDLSRVEVTVAGVTIKMDDEVTDEQAAAIESFSGTEEAAAIRAMASALAGTVSEQQKPAYLGLATLALTLGEGEGMPQFAVGNNCFGCCGPGCWGCHLLGDCYTDACRAHDACVAQHGHLKCLGGLLKAIRSYFEECVLA